MCTGHHGRSLASTGGGRRWLQEQLAMYLHFVDPAQAQKTLAGAVKLNRRVMRPLSGVSYKRARSSIEQASTSSTFLMGQYMDGTELRLGFDQLLAQLVFDHEGARTFEAGLEEVGSLLGFDSQRPERETGSGPDNLWGLGNSRFLVIECKSEATSLVWKKDAGQLAHSMNWFSEKYDDKCTAIPILVHHTGLRAPDAIFPPGARVIDRTRLDTLSRSLAQFATSLAGRDRFDDEESIAELLIHHGLTSQELVQRYTKHAH